MSETPPITKGELAEHLYDNAGREITQNFETMNSNMSLTAGGIAALVTVIGAGELFKGKVQSQIPSLSAISLILLVSIFPLIYRFFFRSLIAYQNLRRFNLVQNAMVRYLEGRLDWSVAADVIDQYLDRWRTPLPFRRAAIENLKYGFFWIFAILGAAIGWGFWSTEGKAARVVASGILFIGILWEAITLPGFIDRYFKAPDAQIDKRINEALKQTDVTARGNQTGDGGGADSRAASKKPDPSPTGKNPTRETPDPSKRYQLEIVPGDFELIVLNTGPKRWQTAIVLMYLTGRSVVRINQELKLSTNPPWMASIDETTAAKAKGFLVDVGAEVEVRRLSAI